MDLGSSSSVSSVTLVLVAFPFRGLLKFFFGLGALGSCISCAFIGCGSTIPHFLGHLVKAMCSLRQSTSGLCSRNQSIPKIISSSPISATAKVAISSCEPIRSPISASCVIMPMAFIELSMLRSWMG